MGIWSSIFGSDDKSESNGPQDKCQEAYSRGKEEGKNAGLLDQFAHNVWHTEGSTKEERSHDKGWHDGVKDQGSSGSSSGGSSGGLCFISTACVVAKGLPDDCLELRTLRNFRDGFVRNLPQGQEIVQDYYATAPRIVQAIAARQGSDAVYTNLYTRLVERSVALIQAGKLQQAFANYQGIVRELKEQYL